MSVPRAVGEGESRYPCPSISSFPGHLPHTWSPVIQDGAVFKGVPFFIPLSFSDYLTFSSPELDSQGRVGG